MTSFIKKGVKAGGSKVSILEEKEEKNADYKSSTFAMSYNLRGRREVIFGKYFSGPYDCSGFQYTIALSDSLTESEALEEIKQFVEKNTGIA